MLMSLLSMARRGLLLSSACAGVSFGLTSVAQAQVVRATVVMQYGDVPASGDGSAIGSLGYPDSTPSGKPVVVGSLTTDNAYVWVGDQIIWLGSQAPTQPYPDGTNTQGSGGANDTGNWVSILKLNNLSTIYTDLGPLLSLDDPAPGFPAGRTIWNVNRATMDTSGAAYFYASIAESGLTVGTALYRSTDRTIGNTTPLLKTGDDLGGFVLDPFGVKTWYAVSRSGGHYVAVVHAVGTDGLAVDGALALKQGDSDGVEGVWDNFDFVDINSGGHYVVSGDTSAPTIRDEFVAYDGTISVREGDTLDGVELLNPASVFAVSINDKGNVAHAWGHNPGSSRTLFYSCDPTNLKNSRRVVGANDELDLDGDGSADATFKRLDFATNVGNGVQLSENDVIYTRAQLNYGASDIQAIIGFPVTCCGDGKVQSGEDCDDGGESATCNADCTAVACGDGKLNATAGEACDDGPTGSATCDADCTIAECGDGVTNPAANEDCDDSGESATCNEDCTTAVCGDMKINTSANEVCDQGGVASATCDADCTAPRCGDGELNQPAGETCDDGGASATCDADCSAVECGDGVLNTAAGEECEDANSSDGDGCSSACKLEGQGNGGSGGSAGAAGAGATSGSGGEGGAAGAGGTAGDGGSSGNESEGGAEDDSGCGCRQAGAPSHGMAPWLLLALGLGVRLTRKRRKTARATQR